MTAECKWLTPLFSLNPRLELAVADVEYVIGVDEVGLGSWAGPLVVAGIVLPKEWVCPAVKDSKAYHDTRSKVAHIQRLEALSAHIEKAEKFSWIAMRTPEEIDKVGIHKSVADATEEAVRKCHERYPQALVVLDGNQEVQYDFVPKDLLIALPKADTIVPAVSAASVMAKVSRDLIMLHLHQEFPRYGFDKHKGYGTPQHLRAIREHGVCPAHRHSYRPVKTAMFQKKLTHQPFREHLIKTGSGGGK